MLAIVSHFHPSLIYASNSGAYPSTGIRTKGRLLALPGNVRLVNVNGKTVAYYGTKLIRAVKSFIIQGSVL